jgi:hypothetical protein
MRSPVKYALKARLFMPSANAVRAAEFAGPEAWKALPALPLLRGSGHALAQKRGKARRNFWSGPCYGLAGTLSDLFFQHGFFFDQHDFVRRRRR